MSPARVPAALAEAVVQAMATGDVLACSRSSRRTSSTTPPSPASPPGGQGSGSGR